MTVLYKKDADQKRGQNDARTLNEGDESRLWSAFDPKYDAAGNTTTIPKLWPNSAPNTSFTLKYDAWNRLVAVYDPAISTSIPIASYEYDGLGQRIVKDVAGTTDDRAYYYNDQWQLVSEVKAGTHYAVYFWHPFYIDALAQRVRSNEIINFMGDDNFNVTAAYKTSTLSVVERYSYSPYGEVTVLDADFAVDSNGVSDIDNTHFYTGRERDPETGLHHYRTRPYASHLGRFTTRDWIEYEGSPYNLYEYVKSNPVKIRRPFKPFSVTGPRWERDRAP